MEIRQAKPSEIKVVQSLDDLMREGGFQHYAELYGMYPQGIWVAVDNEKVIGYIAAERIAQRKLVGARYEEPLPPWDHSPRQFSDPSGDVAYIVGHAVALEYQRRGISNQLIKAFLESAKKQKFEMAAVNHNLRHPTIINPKEFWGRHGFNNILDTYDPRWKHAADKPVDGSIVWAAYLH